MNDLQVFVKEEFVDSLLILDGGECDVGIESTIVDCTRGQPVLLRPGHITRPQIEAACGRALLDKDPLSAEQRVIAQLALQADVGHEAVHVLRVDPGRVGGVGVPVGVTVLAVEEVDEVVAGGDGMAHGGGSFGLKRAKVRMRPMPRRRAPRGSPR